MSFLDRIFGRTHPPMIGLDVSSSSAKLVELGQTPSGDLVLERFASEPFEKGWIADGQIENESAQAGNHVGRNSTRSPMRCDDWSPRVAQRRATWSWPCRNRP